jgi:protein-S-isoprenylcysteine O-methyltransferase Ste14
MRRGHRRWSIAALAALAVAVLVSTHPTPLSSAVGLPLIFAGVGLRVWAVGHLRKTRELTITGPYAWIRHPLYLGTLLIGSGFAALAGVRVAAIALPIGFALFFGYYLPRKERIEGKRLEAIYGERFRAYRAAVRGLVPSLRPWSPSAESGTGTVPVRWSVDRLIDNGELGSVLVVVLALGFVGLHVRWHPEDATLRALRRLREPAVVGALAPARERPGAQHLAPSAWSVIQDSPAQARG